MQLFSFLPFRLPHLAFALYELNPPIFPSPLVCLDLQVNDARANDEMHRRLNSDDECTIPWFVPKNATLSLNIWGSEAESSPVSFHFVCHQHNVIRTRTSRYGVTCRDAVVQ